MFLSASRRERQTPNVFDSELPNTHFASHFKAYSGAQIPVDLSNSKQGQHQLHKISMNSSSFKYESNLPSLLSFRSVRESNLKQERLHSSLGKENNSKHSNMTPSVGGASSRSTSQKNMKIMNMKEIQKKVTKKMKMKSHKAEVVQDQTPEEEEE